MEGGGGTATKDVFSLSIFCIFFCEVYPIFRFSEILKKIKIKILEGEGADLKLLFL